MGRARPVPHHPGLHRRRPRRRYQPPLPKGGRRRRRFGPFVINLQSLGAFPDAEKPRSAWVGVTGPGIDVLGELQSAVAEAAAEAGFPPEDDPIPPPRHPRADQVEEGPGTRHDPPDPPLPDLGRRPVHRGRSPRLRLDPDPRGPLLHGPGPGPAPGGKTARGCLTSPRFSC